MLNYLRFYIGFYYTFSDMNKASLKKLLDGSFKNIDIDTMKGYWNYVRLNLRKIYSNM